MSEIKLKNNQTPQPQNLVNVCGVCDSPASIVFHYGGIVCFSCRAFFRRSIKRKCSYTCRSDSDNCILTETLRGKCKKCRLKKCIEVGMKPEKVDRVKNKNKNNTEDIESREIVDIDDLIEECVLEGLTKPDDSTFLISPVFKLTFEEEFKVHELSVRREYLYDEMFQFFLQISTFCDWENFLMSICRGQFDHHGKWDMFHRFEQNWYFNMKRLNGIPIMASLNMFEGFQNLGEKAKAEMLDFTMPLKIMLIRAILYQNLEKKFFIDQHVASGFYSKSMEEAYYKVFPNNRFAVSSIDPLVAYTQFEKLQDGKFFLDTLKTIGKILKDDIKLGALYTILILSTPGANASDEAKTCQALIADQKSLGLLIFRYLKDSLQDSNLASHTTNNLLMLIGDLHICRDIQMRRKQMA